MGQPSGVSVATFPVLPVVSFLSFQQFHWMWLSSLQLKHPLLRGCLPVPWSDTFLPSGLGVNEAGGGVADWWVKQLEQLLARKRLAEEQNQLSNSSPRIDSDSAEAVGSVIYAEVQIKRYPVKAVVYTM